MTTCSGTIVATYDLQFDSAKRRSDVPRVSYVCADSAAIPLANQSVHAVISHNTMEHFADYKTSRFGRDPGRILRPDGWLWVAVPNAVSHSMTSCTGTCFPVEVMSIALPTTACWKTIARRCDWLIPKISAIAA